MCLFLAYVIKDLSEIVMSAKYQWRSENETVLCKKARNLLVRKKKKYDRDATTKIATLAISNPKDVFGSLNI